jgi:pheromone shutdown protein TraB
MRDICLDASSCYNHSHQTIDQIEENQFQFDCFSDDGFNLNMYIMLKIVIIAFSLDSDIKVFNFLYLFFYNGYFSIIVLKLSLKVQ